MIVKIHVARVLSEEQIQDLSMWIEMGQKESPVVSELRVGYARRNKC